MKSALLLCLPVLLMAASPLAAADAATQPAGKAPPASIQAIASAPDASAAVAAYTAALSANRNDPAVYNAYVRRMVDLGRPQFAAAQARTLVKLDPASGIGWAVVAADAAAQNDYREALTAIRYAAEYAPSDEFVLSQGGAIMGWFDARYKYADLPQEYRLYLSQLSQKLTQNETYAAAYRQAAGLQCPPANGNGGATAKAPADKHPDKYGPAYRAPAPVAGLPPVRPVQQFNNPVVNTFRPLPAQNTPSVVPSGLVPSYGLDRDRRLFDSLPGGVIVAPGGVVAPGAVQGLRIDNDRDDDRRGRNRGRD